MKVKCKHHKRRVLYFDRGGVRVVLHREDGSRCDTRGLRYEAKTPEPIIPPQRDRPPDEPENGEEDGGEG